MGLRTKAREFALQMLFQWDMSPEDTARLEARFWRGATAAKQTREMANRLFEGAAAEAGCSDKLLTEHSEHWRLERLAAIDRAVLRLAVYELKQKETPPKVVLNEALELAKKFSSEESSAFVNGVLDAVHKSLKS
jgi:N utilization substance protein B